MRSLPASLCARLGTFPSQTLPACGFQRSPPHSSFRKAAFPVSLLTDVQVQATRSRFSRCSPLHDSLPWTVQSVESLLPETICLLYKVLWEGGLQLTCLQQLTGQELPYFEEWHFHSSVESVCTGEGVGGERKKSTAGLNKMLAGVVSSPVARRFCLLLFQGVRSHRRGCTQAGTA